MPANFANKISKQRPLSSKSAANQRHELPLNVEQLDSLQRAFESDRGRIINSAALRRLQQKTQVFPLERNAAVRSRLTHSLEVQQVGRFIVQSIFKLLGDKAVDYGLAGLSHQVESLVEMACLLHDIGNPPFGHLGEAAINRWFAARLPKFKPAIADTPSSDTPSSDTSSSDNQSADTKSAAQALWQLIATELAHYEGNAQGIRIVASLQQMNLTFSQSACILKYTRPASLPTAEIPAQLSYLMKKPGFYLTEQAFVSAQNQALGVAPFHRHPLAYVMEAADDISYCLADIEDAVEKVILSLSQVADLLKSRYAACYPELASNALPLIQGLGQPRAFADIIDAALDKATAQGGNTVYEFFIQLRVGFVHPLVQHAARQFVQQIDAVCAGSLNRALLEDHSQYHQITRTFKAVALAHVFSHSEVETLEIQGFNIISGLLDVFAPLLELPQQAFADLLAGNLKGYPLEQRLLHRLPKKYLQQYQLTLAAGLPPTLLQQLPTAEPTDAALQRIYEFYLRTRLLQDHIGGMTDHFAADEYQTLVLCR